MHARQEQVIFRPDQKHHFMRWEYPRAIYRASVRGFIIAETDSAMILTEEAHVPYPPVVYFPRAAVRPGVLVPVDTRTHCPLKGNASYFDVVAGEKRIKIGAWSYDQVLDFDARLSGLEGRVAFERLLVHIEARPL